MRAASVVVLAVLLLADTAARAAGTQPPPSKPPASGSTFTLTHQTSAAGAAARARAAAGDCKSALNLFDDALLSSIDPLLHRDRGLCHEKLGNANAAVDDYRFYLANAPNAPDHDAIEERMKELEATLPKDVVHAAPTSADLQHAVGATPTRLTLDDPKNTKHELEPEDRDKSQSEIDYVERRDMEADSSSTRRGIGPLVGAYYSAGYWARSGFGFTQVIGARIGYSFAGASSILLEIGYRNNRGTGTASQSGGIQLALGYEARIALDRWSSNQILLAVLLGYEDAKQNGSGLLFRSLVPRGRVGWRHVFGRTIGLEFDVDAGPAITFAVDAPAGSQKVVVAPIISGMTSLVIGF